MTVHAHPLAATTPPAWTVPIEMVWQCASPRMKDQLLRRQADFVCLMARDARVELVAAMLYATVEFSSPRAQPIRVPIGPALESVR